MIIIEIINKTLLAALNSKEQSIKFTLERSHNDSLPFLDVMFSWNFKAKVYRKATHTNSYIHYFSHHSLEIKKEVITGLFLRAFRLCAPSCLEDELNFIRSCFSKLAYPMWIIDESLKKARNIYFSCNDKNNWNKEGAKIIKLPYHKKLKEIIRGLDEEDYMFVFYFVNTIPECL